MEKGSHNIEEAKEGLDMKHDFETNVVGIVEEDRI